MSERLELTLRAFEDDGFVGALDGLQAAQQADEKTRDKLWKLVYKNRKDRHSSPDDVSMSTEVAIADADDALEGKELKLYAVSQRKQNELEEKENDFVRQCADEALQLDDISRWAIRRHLPKAMHGRDAMLGGVMMSLGHANAVDGILKEHPYDLLTSFGSFGTIGAAINDGKGLRIDERGGAILTDTLAYTLGTLSMASKNILIAKTGMSLEMRELDVEYGEHTGDWVDILRIGEQKIRDLPALIFGDPVNGPRISDRYHMPENEEYLDDIVERARLVAGLAVGTMVLGDPSLKRFEINPKW